MESDAASITSVRDPPPAYSRKPPKLSPRAWVRLKAQEWWTALSRGKYSSLPHYSVDHDELFERPYSKRFLAVVILLWLGANVADIFWIYIWVRTSANPSRHTGVNRTHSVFIGFTAAMFIYGFILGIVNGYATYLCYRIARRRWKDEKLRSNFGTTRLPHFGWQFFVTTPLALVLLLGPFFSPWVFRAIAQQYAWNHSCEGYPLYTVLHGLGNGSPSTDTNSAWLYQPGSSNASSVFTAKYTPSWTTNWQFSFLYTPSTTPPSMHPTIRYINYFFSNNTLTGSCLIGTRLTPCITGTFDAGSELSFNVTSTAPEDTTSGYPVAPATSRTTFLRAESQGWASNGAPSVILREVDPTSGSLLEPVLRTGITKVSDCTQLKVCVSGTGASPGSVVGAEVLVPLGLLLKYQADYSYGCSSG